MAIPTEPDVLVCGAGCAGLGAALAAARRGARTLVVERAPFAGGIISCAGLPYFDGVARKQDGVIVTRGLPVELLSRLGVCGVSDRTIEPHNPTIPNIERFKVEVDDMLRAESNLTVLYHTFAADVQCSDGRVDGVMIAHKGGVQIIRAETVIDATGDADIAARAGVPLDDNSDLQPLSMHFRIGNVTVGPETRRLCGEALAAACDAGDIANYYGPGFVQFAPDEVYVHATRVPGNGANPENLTRAEMQGRQDAWAMFNVWKRNVPGFEDGYYISSGPYIGVRETRRIAGEYVLTERDVLEGKRFADAVATGCWYIDVHPNVRVAGSANLPVGSIAEVDGLQPGDYDIPYRSMLPRSVSNLLVAGRCHSATRLAASSTRVTATAMAVGQAAGYAAALAAESRTSVKDLDGARVREVMDRDRVGPYARYERSPV